MTDQMINTVIERANEMLKDTNISELYNSFNSKEEAQDWLFKSAVATLVIPVSER